MNNRKEIILLKDLGMRFATEKSKKKYRFGLYLCTCGKEFQANTTDLKRGYIKSCGCLRTTHNLSSHRLYNTWKDMIRRCTNSKHIDYPYYGESGIKVCDRWLDVKNFIEDMYPTF